MMVSVVDPWLQVDISSIVIIFLPTVTGNGTHPKYICDHLFTDLLLLVMGHILSSTTPGGGQGLFIEPPDDLDL